MAKSPELSVTQMRISVQKLGSSTEEFGFGDPTLMRFLIARSMDPENAAKMFVQWHKWRMSMVPKGFISDDEVPDELAAKKIYLQGFLKMGTLFVLSKHTSIYLLRINPNSRYLKWQWLVSDSSYLAAEFVAHILDKTIASSVKEREIGNEKLIAVIDLQQLGYKNVDARGFITGFQFLQAYYPERLAKCFVLNMPWFFVSIWKVISRFLEKATLEKIVIVTSEDEKMNFIGELGEEALPEEYGGRAKLVALQEVKLTPIAMES